MSDRSLAVEWTRGAGSHRGLALPCVTFTFPAKIIEGAASVAIDVHELAMMLEGMNIPRSSCLCTIENPPRASQPITGVSTNQAFQISTW